MTDQHRELPEWVEALGPSTLLVAEQEARRMAALTDAELVGLSKNGSDVVRGLVSAELQRRVMDALGTNTNVQRSAVETLREQMEAQQTLATAVEASGTCAMKQTAEVIKLTNKLRTLTWVLISIGIVQIVVMVVPWFQK